MRIAIAGFQHETNTFAPVVTGLNEFKIADSWPAMLHGAEVIGGTAGINLPIAGFIEEAARHPGIEVVPVLWCAAEPSGLVTDAAFETICAMILDGLRGAGPLDGVYLDLHGAMVTEGHDDGEGELLRRIRALVGKGVPIAVSLDLHANVTRAMVDHASFMAIYRTYPHLDMAGTGARCVVPLLALAGGARLAKAWRQGEYLIPLSAQFTGAEPCRSLYAAATHEGADIALGFTAADIADAGPSIVAYAPTQDEADGIADRLLIALSRAEGQFDCRLLTPEAGVRAAMESDDPRPVILADVQDNPGAGAASDTTGMLSALVKAGARGALLGLMHDPVMVRAAHAAGVGQVIEGALGGRSGFPGQVPFAGQFVVEALSDGQCLFTGEMYGGGVAVLGPSAVLRVGGVQVVVTSARSQCLDLGLFTYFGLDPARARIVCVKSTVHFRADFEPIAAAVLNVAAPGNFACDLTAVAYRNLRAGVRLEPLGPRMT